MKAAVQHTHPSWIRNAQTLRFEQVRCLKPRHLAVCHPKGAIRSLLNAGHQPSCPAWVAMSGNRCIALAVAIDNFRYSYHGLAPIITVMVHPEWRKQGIGSELVRRVTATLKQQDCEFVYYGTDWVGRQLEAAGIEGVNGAWSDLLDTVAVENEVVNYQAPRI